MVFENDNLPVERNHQTEVYQTSAITEVQARYQMAVFRPRDTTAAYTKIMQNCQRLGFAQDALYNLPISGRAQIGPSVHLAKEMARSWQNLKFGIKELSRSPGKSLHLAYCIDLETNTSSDLEFEVEHWIEKKAETPNGPRIKKAITDPNEIDRLIANRGARKVRNCILDTLPNDIISDAENACKATLAKGNGEPISDRIRKIVVTFSSYGVTQDMIEARLGYKIDLATGEDLVNLTAIGKSLQDKQSKRSDYFNTGEKEESEKGLSLNDKLKAQQEAKKQEQEIVKPTENTKETIQKVADLNTVLPEAKEWTEVKPKERSVVETMAGRTKATDWPKYKDTSIKDIPEDELLGLLSEFDKKDSISENSKTFYVNACMYLGRQQSLKQ